MIPSEYTLYKQIQKLQPQLATKGITIEFRENTQFLITQEEFINQFAKPPVMETFYRWMRKKFDILMQDGKPE
jgi:deoxyribodipyrimidine photolyase-related protein